MDDLSDDDDEDENDPDILLDPVYSTNIQQYLIEFLSSLSQQSFFHIFSQHLTENEKAVLKLIGVSVWRDLQMELVPVTCDFVL